MDILTNKQYKTYTKLSRYSVFPIYYNTLDKRYMGGMTSYLEENTTYNNHQVIDTDTLDTLALFYYGNPTYFWIIADFNRIQDPFNDLVVGSTIKIPSFSNIQFNI